MCKQDIFRYTVLYFESSGNMYSISEEDTHFTGYRFSPRDKDQQKGRTVSFQFGKAGMYGKPRSAADCYS